MGVVTEAVVRLRPVPDCVRYGETAHMSDYCGFGHGCCRFVTMLGKLSMSFPY